MQMQAIAVSGGDSSDWKALKEDLERLSKILPTKAFSDNMSKKKLTERVTSGQASLIHFLGHGTPVGKTDCHQRRNISSYAHVIPHDLKHLLLLVVFNFGLVMSSEKDKDWAGLYLASKEVLTAYDLHESFAENKSSVALSLTRLLVLCACSSGMPCHEME